MYVCVCKAVTDRQIRSAVEEGITSMSGLRQNLGCSGQCGKCARHVKQIRDDTLATLEMPGIGTVIPVFAAA